MSSVKLKDKQNKEDKELLASQGRSPSDLQQTADQQEDASDNTIMAL